MCGRYVSPDTAAIGRRPSGARSSQFLEFILPFRPEFAIRRQAYKSQLETAMITPPVGINLYVVQGLRTRGRIDDVIIGSAPFLVTMLVMLALLSYFPDLAMWLPRAAAD